MWGEFMVEAGAGPFGGLALELLDRTRNEKQRIDQRECGDAVADGQGSQGQGTASFSGRLNLVEGRVAGPDCKDSDDSGAKNPDAGGGDY